MNKRLLLKNKNMNNVLLNTRKVEVVPVLVHQRKEKLQQQKLHPPKNHRRNLHQKKVQLNRNHLKKIMTMMMMKMMMKNKFNN
jgi:hypothetical protein